MIRLITPWDSLRSKAGDSLSSNTQFTLGKELNSIDTRISDFNKRLTQVEDRYYKQFTAMETAINKANGQSGYLASFFSK